MQLEISVQVGQVHWIGVWKGVPRYWKKVGPESLVHSEHLGKEKEKRSERERESMGFRVKVRDSWNTNR